MNVTIREAQPADLAGVVVLFDLYRQFYEQPPDRELAHQFIAARIARRDSVLLLATRPQPGLLGFCQLYPTFCSVEARPVYTLHDLFVHPSARNAGVGRLLLQAAEARAASDGKSRMDLSTARTNTTAQSLYESLGWVRDERFHSYSLRVAVTR